MTLSCVTASTSLGLSSLAKDLALARLERPIKEFLELISKS